MIPATEELTDPSKDISLGEVLQIPTVEELQQEPIQQSSSETIHLEQEAVPETESATVELQDEPSRIEPPIEEPPDSPVTAPQFQTVEEPIEEVDEGVEEYEEDSGSGLKKVILVILLLGFVAAAAAFYFYRKANSAENQDLSQLPPETRQPAAVEPQDDELVEEEQQAPGETVEKQNVEKENQRTERVPASPAKLAATGNLSEAASLWRKELNNKRNQFTIQVEIACQDSTVLEALNLLSASSKVYVVPMDFKGRSCYRVLYGTYPDQTQAERDLSDLPRQFLDTPSPPKVIPVWKALQ